MNSILLFSLFLAVIVAAEPINKKRPMLGDIDGGVSIVQDEARQRGLIELLGEHIGKLEAGNWAIVNISKVGQQVVGGMKYYYYGTFGDRHENKIYAATITLYTRPWEDYFEVNMQDKTQIH